MPTSVTPGTYTITDPYGNVSSPIYWGDVTVSSGGDRVVLQSVKTPDYHVRKAAGDLIPITDYHVVTSTFTQTATPVWVEVKGSRPGVPYGCTVTYVYQGIPGRFQATLAPPSFPAVDLGNRPILIQKAVANMLSTEYDLLTELAELPQAIGLILDFKKNLKSRATKLINTFVRLRKKGKYGKKLQVRPGFLSLAEAIGIFSDLWLEYRYGWRQLKFSADAIKAALDRAHQGTDFIVEGKAAEKQEHTSSATWSSFYYPNSIFRIGPPAYEHACTYRVGAFAQRKVSVALAATIDPLVTAWELFPYSFVLDWGINVSDILKAHSPFTISRPTTIGWSVRKSVNAHCTVGLLPHSTHCSVDYPPRHASLLVEDYERHPWLDPVPFGFEFNPRINVPRAADLSALFWGQFNRWIHARMRRK